MMEKGLNTYDRVMNIVLGHAKVDQKQIEELMDKIAYHETDGTMRTDMHQYKGGPARGLFQYELKASKKTPKASGHGRTAMNRLYSVLGGVLPSKGGKPASDPINMPDWMEPYFKRNRYGAYEASGDVDFSKLTGEQQRTIFLADKLKTKGAIPSIGMDKDSKWWSIYHQKGDSNIKDFEEDSGRYSFQKHRLKALENAYYRIYK